MSVRRIRRDNPSPAAFPVQPSRQFQGNDGSWSTFLISAGSPAQQFSALVSTSSLGTWLVGPAACSSSSDPTVAQHSDCFTSRGSKANKGWQSADSKTYKALGTYVLELNNDLPLATTFGSSPVGVNYTGAVYNSNATLGQDTVALLSNDNTGSPITANNSLIYGVVDQSFWLSTFGIGHGTTQLGQDTSKFASLLDIYANQSAIPSRTWGYTAGAFYNNSFGSLTLGGYDSARIGEPVADFKMDTFRGGKGVSQLMVSVQSIAVNSASSTITSITKTNDATTTFNAVIDSTIPYLYLPQAVCDKFASVYGLRYDATTDLYLINATQRTANAGTSIHIVVSDTTAGLKTSKEIIFPYAAFDLNASWPIFDNPVTYFPIRRAAGDKAILGRTFLQEAYVVADFERNNFTLGRAVDTHSGLQNIVPIISPVQKTGESSSSSSTKLGTGAIAGVAIGGLAGILVAAAALWMLFSRRKRRNANIPAVVPVEEKIDDAVDDRPSHLRHLSELSGVSTAVSTGLRKSFIPGETVYEADNSGEVHEMDGKTDTAAWARNQAAHRERTEAFELEGDGVLREGNTPTLTPAR